MNKATPEVLYQNEEQHIKNILEEGELELNSVVKEFFTTVSDGKNYATNYYNLDMIISVGYRVKSSIATAFRKWATLRLREYKNGIIWPHKVRPCEAKFLGIKL